MAEFYRPGSILILQHATGIESVTVIPLRGVDTFFSLVICHHPE
jgi:hypothetical protein